MEEYQEKLLAKQALESCKGSYSDILSELNNCMVCGLGMTHPITVLCVKCLYNRTLSWIGPPMRSEITMESVYGLVVKMAE